MIYILLCGIVLILHAGASKSLQKRPAASHNSWERSVSTIPKSMDLSLLLHTLRGVNVGAKYTGGAHI